jgi:hypothetical protein
MARLYLAPVGTAAPADPVVAPDAAWVDVGYFTPDSLSWSTDPSFEEVQSHQSNYPTRRWQTADAATVEVDLQEWSLANFQAIYGGGTVVEVPASPGPPEIALHYKFSPPAIGTRTQTAAMIEIVDGTSRYRMIIPKCEQTEGAELSLEKTSESTLPLRLSIIGSDVGDPWYLITTASSFEPPA